MCKLFAKQKHISIKVLKNTTITKWHWALTRSCAVRWMLKCGYYTLYRDGILGQYCSQIYSYIQNVVNCSYIDAVRGFQISSVVSKIRRGTKNTPPPQYSRYRNTQVRRGLMPVLIKNLHFFGSGGKKTCPLPPSILFCQSRDRVDPPLAPPMYVLMTYK